MTILALVHRDDPTSDLALEAALQLDSGEVVAAAIGSAAQDEALRAAVAAGAQRPIRLKRDDDVSLSGVADAVALVPLIEQIEPEVVLLGARRGKLGTYGAGPALAELTGRPHIGSVSSVAFADGRLEVQRRRESQLQTISCPTPAVISVEWGARLRYPTLPGRLYARRTEIHVTAATSAAEPRVAVLRRTGPKPRRKLEQRTAPAVDHVLGMLLGGAAGGGGGRQLEGASANVAAQVVAACSRVLEGAS